MNLHVAPPPPSGVIPYVPELSIALLTDMLRIRRLEEKSAELYGAGKIRGFLHLYVGEEASRKRSPCCAPPSGLRARTKSGP
jgi:pyruvate dehydrogenase E1 component alpha subunit